RRPGLRCDLAIGEALPLAQQDDRAVSLGHPLQCFGQLRRLAGRVLRRRDDVLERVEVPDGFDATAPPRALTPRATDVLRDLEEPGRFELRANPAAQATVRVQEGRLHRVLRLFAVAEQPEAVAEDPLRVPRVE